MSRERYLSAKQPWSSLIMAGAKDVENRSWAVPSTLPRHLRCERCGDEWDRIHPLPAHAHYRDVGRRLPERCLGPITDRGPFPFRLWTQAGKGWDYRSWPEYLDGHRDADLDKVNALADVGAQVDECEDGFWRVWRPSLPRGVLLGSVTVTGCHHADECEHVSDRHFNERTRLATYTTAHCSPWAEPDAYHWTVKDPVPLPEPIPLRGYQGLPFLPDDVLAEAESVTA